MLIHCILWRKKLGDLQKYSAAWRRKTGPQELLAMFETLSMFRVSWKCTQNTSKINPCTVLVQEITNEDHNDCEHCDWNRSDSLPALTHANMSDFFWGLLFNFVSRPARASLVASKKMQMDWISSPSKPARPDCLALGKKLVQLPMLCCYCAATENSAVEDCSLPGWGTVKEWIRKINSVENQTHVFSITTCHSSTWQEIHLRKLNLVYI
jgi:hypothetical protein